MTGEVDDALANRAERKKKARKRKRGPYRKSWSPKV